MWNYIITRQCGIIFNSGNVELNLNQAMWNYFITQAMWNGILTDPDIPLCVSMLNLLDVLMRRDER